VTLDLRLRSMFLDHFIMCFIIVPPLILIRYIFKSDQPFETNHIETASFYLMMLVYLNKDFVGAKSIAKRILGLRIIDCKTGKPANELKCFLRNMTIPLWPLEVLISLFSKTRRLGDIIANTKIEIAEKENPKSILVELKYKRLTSKTFLTLIIGIAYMMILWYVVGIILKM
jgi:uncharacterized RDD family membrane protein YckC